MPFYDSYPTTPPIATRPPANQAAIIRLENLIGLFLDQLMVRKALSGKIISDDGSAPFPASGIPRDQLQQLANALAANEEHVTVVNLKIVPWYMKWWETGPVSKIIVHFQL